MAEPKFRCFNKALYMGKECEIRGVTRGHATNPRIGVRYDVRIHTAHGHSYDYRNIPESHLTEIPKPKTNEVLQFVAEANRLRKAQPRV